MAKLNELAHGQDEQGCSKEASARVRAAAENALNACRRKTAPTQPASLQPIPEKQKEVPIEGPSPAPKADVIPSPTAAPTASESAGSSLEFPYSVTVRIIPASAVAE
jgi:hypothetical protein